jgi:hypothetical protein
MLPASTPQANIEKSFYQTTKKREPLVKIEVPTTNPTRWSLIKYNDDIRLQKFRQLKREIRMSSEFLIVGIDIAKERRHAFFGTPTGKTLLR